MYGFRARIGLIIPSNDDTMEPEFNAMKPEGVSVHAARLLHKGGEISKRMAEGTEEAAELLATAGVSIIAYGCTIGSIIGGPGFDQELINRIERVTNIPATTTATAVAQAFSELGISKVAVASPCGENSNRLLKEFLEMHGVSVVNIKGLGSTASEIMQSRLPEHTYKLASEVDTPEADAIFISCTGFKSITVIEELESNLRKYVFSSNTATMWDILKRLGIREKIKGYGKLLATLGG